MTPGHTLQESIDVSCIEIYSLTQIAINISMLVMFTIDCLTHIARIVDCGGTTNQLLNLHRKQSFDVGCYSNQPSDLYCLTSVDVSDIKIDSMTHIAREFYTIMNFYTICLIIFILRYVNTNV